MASFDDGCPNIVQNETQGMPLYIEDGKVNPMIVSDFVTQPFLQHQEEIFSISEGFVNFCLANNFLAPYTDFYKTNPLYLNFKPTLKENLFVLHPQRIAVMRMQNKDLFKNNENYLQYIQKIIGSAKNIEVLSNLTR